LKQAAFDAYCQAERAQEEERLSRFLDASDPGAMADALRGPIQQEIDAYQVPTDDPPPITQKHKRPASASPRPSRQRDLAQQRRDRARERRLRKILFKAAPTRDVKRLRAWVFYRLKIYDLHLQQQIRLRQARIDRLRRPPRGTPEGPACEVHFPLDRLPKFQFPWNVIEYDLWAWMRHVRVRKGHAHEEVSMAPSPNKERGPP